MKLEINFKDIIFFSPCRCIPKNEIDSIHSVWGLVRIEINEKVRQTYSRGREDDTKNSNIVPDQPPQLR